MPLERIVRVKWRPKAEEDLLGLVAYIAKDNPDAAQALFDEVREKAAQAVKHPALYKIGRMRGTREIVVRPNYVVVYRIADDVLNVIRVLHARQQWPVRT